MKCSKCQTENTQDSQFCKKCAASLISIENTQSSFTKTLETPVYEPTRGATFAGRYEILGELGRGGMGVVYKAQDSKLNRTVALKFLPPELTHISDVKERFLREAHAAAGLDHPNICTVYELDEAEMKTFISMAYIKGQNLREKIEANPLNLDEILNIAIQIAEGLSEAHRKGIVHRDIKSANIMVTDKDRVKIMDFGLAKIAGSTLVTQEGTTMGTIAYMSPEQIRGKEVDYRTDIWSLGVVLFEMLTGQLPFEGKHDQAVMYSIVNEDPRPITGVRAGIPMDLEYLVGKAMEKDPTDRYQNVDEILVDLKSLKKEFKSGVTTTKLTNTKSPGKKRPYPYVGITALCVVLIVGGLFLWKRLVSDRMVLESSSLSGLKRLAVLPFANIRSDPQTDFLGFALADQIIGDLAYAKNVLARPSSAVRQYQNQEVDVLAAGQDLKVDFIVMGHYLKEGDIVRLNIELVNVHSNEMIWREPIQVRYENVFELQDLVTKKVIDGLKTQFLQDERKRIQTDIPQNPLAYEYYLRSISYPFSNEGDQLAIEMLKKTIELDPNYAPAYDQLGDRIHRLAQFGLLDPEENKRAENSYLKALSLNEELLSALGNLAMLYAETARIEKAVEITRQMLEINPNNATAHFSLGYIYRYAGMLNESVQEMEKAVTLDPKNPEFRSIVITYQYVGEYEKAFETSRIYKESAFTLGEQGVTFFRQGKQKQAVEYFDRVIAMEPDGLMALWVTGMKAFIEGNIEAGLDAARKFEQANITDVEAWYSFAGNYGLLGDKEGCIRTLQRAVDGGFFNYPVMLTDSFLDSVRDDPEFQRILEMAKAKHEAFKKRFFPGRSVSTV